VKAFVAGSTGLTGRHVTEALVERGIDTIAHVRPDSSRLAHWQEHFDRLGARVNTTAWSLTELTATLQWEKPDLVFALLGTTRKRARAAARDGVDAGYEAVDYGLTVMLIDACRGLDCRFVYLSSIGVGPRAAGAYLKVRWRAEEHLRQSGLDWTIARPSTISGDRDETRPGEATAAAVGDKLLKVARLFGASRAADTWASNTGRSLGYALARLSIDPAFSGQVVQGADLRTPDPTSGN